MSHVIGVPEQDKYENLDRSSAITVDETTGLAQRLGSDGKPQGEPKPLAELLDEKEVAADPKPKARNFSSQARRDQHLDGSKE